MREEAFCLRGPPPEGISSHEYIQPPGAAANLRLPAGVGSRLAAALIARLYSKHG
jgi:hypothetical protein